MTHLQQARIEKVAMEQKQQEMMNAGCQIGAIGQACAPVRRTVTIDGDYFGAERTNIESWQVDEICTTLVQAALRSGVTQFTLTVKQGEGG